MNKRKNIHQPFWLTILGCMYLLAIHAQESPLRLGYYAPYGQFGINASTQFTLHQWNADSTTQLKRMHSIFLIPQLGYYYQPDVQYNALLQAEGIWVSQKKNHRFYPFTGIGLGYMLSFQKQEATIHLGTGNVNSSYATLHRLTTTLNAGFGILPKRQLGMYFKLFYGGRFTINASNDAFFGGELGLTYYFKKRTRHE